MMMAVNKRIPVFTDGDPVRGGQRLVTGEKHVLVNWGILGVLLIIYWIFGISQWSKFYLYNWLDYNNI